MKIEIDPALIAAVRRHARAEAAHSEALASLQAAQAAVYEASTNLALADRDVRLQWERLAAVLRDEVATAAGEAPAIPQSCAHGDCPQVQPHPRCPHCGGSGSTGAGACCCTCARCRSVGVPVGR